MHNPWVSSVQPVEGSPTPMDMESNQVTEASSMSLEKIYNKLSSLQHIKDISELRMPSNRKSYGINEIIYIPAGVEQWVINGVEFEGVSTSVIKTGDDALIVDGGAACNFYIDNII